MHGGSAFSAQSVGADRAEPFVFRDGLRAGRGIGYAALQNPPGVLKLRRLICNWIVEQHPQLAGAR